MTVFLLRQGRGFRLFQYLVACCELLGLRCIRDSLCKIQNWGQVRGDKFGGGGAELPDHNFVRLVILFSNNVANRSILQTHNFKGSIRENVTFETDNYFSMSVRILRKKSMVNS